MFIFPNILHPYTNSVWTSTINTHWLNTMHLQWIIYERNIEVSFHHSKAFRYCNFFLLSAIIYDFWDLYKTDKTDIKFVSYHISCIMYISEIWCNLFKYIDKLYKPTILSCDLLWCFDSIWTYFYYTFQCMKYEYGIFCSSIIY